MPKRKLYIHIGPHKTGTTSIQRGLVANHAVLEARGYHYPEVGYIFDGHHNLVFELNEDEKFVPMLGGLKELMAFAENSEGHIILSSETFDTIITRPPIEKLKAALGGIFDIHVIGYLRPQEELLQSLWKTNVRFEGLMDDFEDWLPAAMDRWAFLEYDKWISVFLDVLGRDNVHFNLYDPKSDDLLFQFLRSCGLSDFKGFETIERENVSLPSLTFELVRRFYINPYIKRRKGPDGTVPIQKSSYANVSRIVTKFMAGENIDQSYSCYSKTMIQTVRQRFRPHNQAAAKLYFDRHKLFPAAKKLKPAPHKLVDFLTPDQALRLGGEVIDMEQKRAKNAQKRLAELEAKLGPESA